MPQLLILTALLPEAQAIAHALQLSPAKNTPYIWQNNTGIQLQIVGIRATTLPPKTNAKALLLAGLAGALSPKLLIGDIVIDGPLNIKMPFPFTSGPIHTATQIISTPAEKKSLYEKTHALAVDMETTPVRQFALTHNTPFLTLRSISDTSADPLDPAFLTLVDSLGRPRISHAMSMLCLKPWKLKAMLRLKKNSDLALKNLGHAVAGIIAAGWPGAKENAAK